MISLDEFIEEIVEIVEKQISLCDPERDIEPAVFVMDQEEKCELLGAGDFFADEQTKVLFAAKILPAIIRKSDAEYFSVVSMQWQMTSENIALFDQFEAWRRDNPGVSWDQNPVVQPGEFLGIMYGARDGTIGMKSAEVTRSKDSAPTLGEWESAQATWGETELSMSGRMLDYGMEAITGRRIVTADSIAKAAHGISRSTEFQAMFIEVWAAMGMTPDEGMEWMNNQGAEAYLELREKLRETFPQYDEMIEALVAEHLPQASDAILSEVGVPGGVLVMVDEEGNFKPLDGFFGDGAFDDLLGKGKDEPPA